MELDILLGCAASVFAVLFGYSTWRAARFKHENLLGKDAGVVVTEIRYIKDGVDDIRRKQDRQTEQLNALGQRVTAAETSTKQAHLRIDRIERFERRDSESK